MQAERRRGGEPGSERQGEYDVVSQWCAHCGDAVPVEEWHPVVTARDDDGDVEIHDFCEESCRDAWAADRETREE